MGINLALAVQYGQPVPQLPRWRLRRWVQRSLDAAAEQHEELRAAVLTLRLVDDEEGRALNNAYRQHDYATNVLTFEYGLDEEGTVSADLVLCVPVLEREAHEQGKTLHDHAAHLVVHGVLHALGHDHLNDAEAFEMETLEKHILNTLGIADPYQDYSRAPT